MLADDLEAAQEPQPSSVSSSPLRKIDTHIALQRLDSIFRRTTAETFSRMRARFVSRFEAFDRDDGTATVVEIALMFDVNESLAQKLLDTYFGGATVLKKEDFVKGVERLYHGQSERALFDLAKEIDSETDPSNDLPGAFLEFVNNLTASKRNISDATDPEWLNTLFLNTLKRYENGAISYNRAQTLQKRGRCRDFLFLAYYHRLEITWAVLLWGITVFCFLYKFLYYYYDRPDAMDVFGICICFARGSALAINYLVIIVLLTVARSFWTWIRQIKHGVLLHVIPLDKLIHMHKIAGVAILCFATIHVSAHICDFHRIGEASLEDLSTLLRRNVTEPITTAYMWTQSIPGTTGLAMVAIFAVAYPFTLPQFRKTQHFKLFWMTHQLLICFCIILAAHGTASLLEPFASVYFVCVPLALYLIERVYRLYGSAFQSTRAKILSITPVAQRVIRLEVEKPEGNTALTQRRWNTFTPGGYAFVNVPAIAFSEWHPFSLTSAPQDATVTFHIQAVGDWTKSLMACIESPPEYCHLDGPFGAPSQSYLDYDVSIFIAGGIGVTPYASILSSFRDPARRFKLKKVILVWIVRGAEDLDWMKDLLMKVISECHAFVEIVRFVTDKNLANKIEEVEGMMTIHGKRPDLDYVLLSAMATARQFDSECGVFFTGNETLGDSIKTMCLRLSQNSEENTGDQFDFRFYREVF